MEQNLEALHESAVEVAHRLTQFDSYGASPRRALKALERRRPGYVPEEYDVALSRATQLMLQARKLVNQHSEELLLRYSSTNEVQVGLLVPELQGRFPEYQQATVASVLAWMFYYWHLR